MHLATWVPAAFVFIFSSQTAAQTPSAISVPAAPTSIFESSGDKTALLRVTVVDSTVLTGNEFSSSQKKIASTEIKEAKNIGAIEKSKIATYFSSEKITAFWNLQKSQPFIATTRLFSNRIVEEIDRTSPSLLSGLSESYPAFFSGRKLSERLPSRSFMAAPLGFTRTILGKDGGARFAEIDLIPGISGYGKQLYSRAKDLNVLAKDVDQTLAAVPSRPPTPTAPVYTYLVRLPAKDVPAFKTAINPDGISGAISTISNPSDMLEVRPAGEIRPSESEDFQISDSGKAVLVKVFSQKPVANTNKRPVLIILDDAIPSQVAWQDTKRFLSEAEADIIRLSERDKEWAQPIKNLPDSDWEPTIIQGPAGLKGCEKGVEDAACNFHAKKIERALIPLKKLAHPDNQPVRVVWIPIFNTQPGSFALLTRIFRTVESTPGTLITGSGNARKFTDNEFSRLSEDLANLKDQLLIKYPATKNDWKTPGPVLYNTVQFARWYAALTKIPVFINLSWTFPTDVMGERPEGGVYKTVIVVAAGNPCVHEDTCPGYTEDDKIGEYDFLHAWSFSRDRYIVVADIGMDGNVACFSATPKPVAGLFAFPGNIKGDCGTSYSAPRVAWLMAARESYRKVDPSYDKEIRKWYNMVYHNAFAKRDPTGCKKRTDLRCASLDVEDLFADVKY